MHNNCCCHEHLRAVCHNDSVVSTSQHSSYAPSSFGSFFAATASDWTGGPILLVLSALLLLLLLDSSKKINGTANVWPPPVLLKQWKQKLHSLWQTNDCCFVWLCFITVLFNLITDFTHGRMSVSVWAKPSFISNHWLAMAFVRKTGRNSCCKIKWLLHNICTGTNMFLAMVGTRWSTVTWQWWSSMKSHIMHCWTWFTLNAKEEVTLILPACFFQTSNLAGTAPPQMERTIRSFSWSSKRLLSSSSAMAPSTTSLSSLSDVSSTETYFMGAIFLAGKESDTNIRRAPKQSTRLSATLALFGSLTPSSSGQWLL